MTVPPPPPPPWSRLLRPRSVAVVGASPKPGSYGLQAVRYLQRFPGSADVWPVNPSHAEVEGLRCYPELAALPHAPDVAILLLASDRLPAAVEACAAAGVGFAILPGDLPRLRWAAVRRAAGLDGARAGAPVRLVGPSCVGVIHARDELALSTSSALRSGRLLPGRIGVVSQSGGVLGSLLNRGQDRSLGFSHLISCGQEIDLTALDFVEMLLDETDGAVTAAVLENVRGAARFRALAERAAERDRPLVLLCAGRSAAGRVVAETHSGRLAGDEDAWRALVRQSGARTVATVDALLDVAAAFAAERRPSGRRLGVVSTSGGFCAHVADLCAEAGLETPALSEESAKALERIVGAGPLANPLDVAAAGRPDAGPALVRCALETMQRDGGLDVLVAADTTLLPAAELAEEVLAFARETRRPFATCWTGGEHTLDAVRGLEEAGALVFRTADGMAAALAACADHHEWRLRREADAAAPPPALALERDALHARLPAAGGALSEPATKAILSCAGIAVTREAVARSAEEAAAHAEAIGLPVALKWVSSRVVHKSDRGGVRLGIASAADAIRVYGELVATARANGLDREIEGILVQEMKPAGLELFVGARRAPGIGVVVLCGLGGLWVEVLGDVSRRIAPLSRSEAEAMWRELRAYPLLAGARGGVPLDAAALADVVLRIAALAEALGDRLEALDVNPLVADPARSGVCVLDAALNLHPSGDPNA